MTTLLTVLIYSFLGLCCRKDPGLQNPLIWSSSAILRTVSSLKIKITFWIVSARNEHYYQNAAVRADTVVKYINTFQQSGLKNLEYFGGVPWFLAVLHITVCAHIFNTFQSLYTVWRAQFIHQCDYFSILNTANWEPENGKVWVKNRKQGGTNENYSPTGKWENTVLNSDTFTNSLDYLRC